MPSVSARLCAGAAAAVQARADDPALQRAAATVRQAVTSVPEGEQADAARRVVQFAGELDAARPRHLAQPGAKRPRLD
jgi:hypothetical protein